MRTHVPPQALKVDLDREWRSPEAKLVWLLRAVLVALTVFALSVEPRYTTRPLLVLSAIAGLAVSGLFAFIKTKRPRTLKAAEAAVLVAFVFHVVGHALGFYERWLYYDKVLHFVESIAVALVLFALSQATRWVWSWTDVKPFEVALYLFCLAVTAGVFWELLEFGMDVVFRTEEQNGNTDTMLDLLGDTVGALVGAAGAAWATRVARTKGPERVSETPRRRERRAVSR